MSFLHLSISFSEQSRPNHGTDQVPLFISYPKRLKNIGLQVLPGLTWHLDLMPTILAYAGITVQGSVRGLDLTGVIMGRGLVPKDRSIFLGVLRIPHEGRAPLRRVVYQHGFKFIEGHPYFGDPDGFLFDLDASAQEQQNLRLRAPPQFNALAEQARDYTSSLVIRHARDRVTGQLITALPGEISGIAELDPDEEAALRALGYRD